ncbi:MAG: diguanylate cyclase [Candidatus Hydrogenedentes bacterium]|nr:diguanylate cyclase [Candidatus Hydrogenedentota bacterium]
MSTTGKSLVLIADPRTESREALGRVLEEAGYEVRLAASAVDALKGFYAEPPHCMLVRYEMATDGGANLLCELKSDNVYGHLPAIVLLTPDELACGVDWLAVPADDFVVDPIQGPDLVARIQLCWSRALRDVNANPLTGLPGNLLISREAERRLASGMPFAFAYMDLDGFKSFNDRYGFARGDEVLRMTARILVNTVRAVDGRNTHVGHVGGDDFVFITSPGKITRVCEQINAAFDSIVRDFYDTEDRKQGGIQSIDRQGNPVWCPVVSCSIGAVDTESSKVTHIAALFHRVTEVKNFAKKLQGSNFIIDRRQ